MKRLPAKLWKHRARCDREIAVIETAVAHRNDENGSDGDDDDGGDSAAVRGNISDVPVLLVPDGFWVQSAPLGQGLGRRFSTSRTRIGHQPVSR